MGGKEATVALKSFGSGDDSLKETFLLLLQLQG